MRGNVDGAGRGSSRFRTIRMLPLLTPVKSRCIQPFMDISLSDLARNETEGERVLRQLADAQLSYQSQQSAFNNGMNVFNVYPFPAKDVKTSFPYPRDNVHAMKPWQYAGLFV